MHSYCVVFRCLQHAFLLWSLGVFSIHSLGVFSMHWSLGVFRMSLVLHDIMIMCVQLCNSRLKTCHLCNSCHLCPSSCHITMSREDPLKIFVGSLNPDINKPQLLNLFGALNLTPVDVIVPAVHANKLAFAFVTFNSHQECQQAIGMLHGELDSRFSPGAMKAHIGDPSWESL